MSKEFNFKKLETDRLLLRLLDQIGLDHVLEVFSDDELVSFFGLKSTDQLDAALKPYREGMSMHGKTFAFFHMIEKESDALIGWAGYHIWYTKHHRAELGYEIHDDAKKRMGYMSEALPPIIKYGFKKMNLHRIEAMVGPNNVPSLKLIEKLGFKKEGHMKEHYLRDGIWEDSLVFGLLKSYL